MKLSHFDPSAVDPSDVFEPLPPNKYNVLIIKTEERETKTGEGRYLELTLQVMEGEHIGRLIWDRLNLDNPNSQAVMFAEKALSQICHALDLSSIDDSSELVGMALTVKLVIREDKNGEYEPQNQVRKYMECEGDASSYQMPDSPDDVVCDDPPEGVTSCGNCTSKKCENSPKYKKKKNKKNKGKKSKKNKVSTDEFNDL